MNIRRTRNVHRTAQIGDGEVDHDGVSGGVSGGCRVRSVMMMMMMMSAVSELSLCCVCSIAVGRILISRQQFSVNCSGRSVSRIKSHALCSNILLYALPISHV